MLDLGSWKFIKKNKKITHRSVRLTIDLFLGYMKNGTTWISPVEYSQVSGVAEIPWQDIQVKVSINGTLLYSGFPLTKTSINYSFLDSDEITQHDLQIEICGFANHHNNFWPITNESGGVCLYFRGDIENIPLNLLLSKLGKYVLNDGSINVATDLLGQNGYQTLIIKTPFYTWLHQNRELLIKESPQPVKSPIENLPI